MNYPIDQIRADFPILQKKIHEHPLVYLDSAASAQKPQIVLDAMNDFYTGSYANIHRGVSTLAVAATDAYEAARQTVADCIHAPSVDEVIFTRGTTESINLVAASWGRAHITAGDEIIVTLMEHHSNFVPWQQLAHETGAILRVAPLTPAGEMDMPAFTELLSEQTKLVAVAHASNTLGTINPIREIADMAHAVGALVIVDGAQAVPHLAVDVQALGADFYTFSGHKVYGPSGIGVLWGRMSLLTDMPPYQTGGGMIERVTIEQTTFTDLPARFEAGTPPIVEAVGLAAALRYVTAIGFDAICAHENMLMQYATARLAEISGLHIIGQAASKVGVISFVLDGVHAHDLGTILDDTGVVVRVGHHCTQPLLASLDMPATARASFGIYNTKQDVDTLIAGIQQAASFFQSTI